MNYTKNATAVAIYVGVAVLALAFSVGVWAVDELKSGSSNLYCTNAVGVPAGGWGHCISKLRWDNSTTEDVKIYSTSEKAWPNCSKCLIKETSSSFENSDVWMVDTTKSGCSVSDVTGNGWDKMSDKFVAKCKSTGDSCLIQSKDEGLTWGCMAVVINDIIVAMVSPYDKDHMSKYSTADGYNDSLCSVYPSNATAGNVHAVVRLDCYDACTVTTVDGDKTLCDTPPTDNQYNPTCAADKNCDFVPCGTAWSSEYPEADCTITMSVTAD